MLLTYWRVHLLFTLPPTLFLFVLVRPFLGRRDVGRILWHAGIATAYTFPWDSYIISRKAWWYAPWAVSFTVGNVPIEEVCFFVIQSVMTSLLFIAITLPKLPALQLNAELLPRRAWWTRWLPVPALLFVAATGWQWAIPATHAFYMGCIAFWATPVLAFLWTLGGDHVLDRRRICLAAILIPTAYLCCVDVIALRAGTWHINEATSFEIYPVPDLPLEEMVFFLVTNSLVVCGMTAFDKAFAILDLFPDAVDGRPADQRTKPGYSLEYITLLLKALWIPLDRKRYLPISTRYRVKELQEVAGMLQKHSHSFSTAALAFPASSRTSLLILYGFCRATDNLIDEAGSSAAATERLKLITDYLDVVYSQPAHRPNSWSLSAFLHSRSVPKEAQAAFLLLGSLGARAVPREPFDALCKGYAFDSTEKWVAPKDNDELVYYARCVAGSVAEMCVYAIYAAEMGLSHDKVDPVVLSAANDMGVALQLVNIARDLRDDAKLGRSYLPEEWNIQGRPGEKQFDYAAAVTRLLALAEIYRSRSEGSIAKLPSGCRAGLRAATSAYCAIGVELRAAISRPGFDGERIFVPGKKRALVALLEAYGIGQLRGRSRRLA